MAGAPRQLEIERAGARDDAHALGVEVKPP
jgi:hypothetical protein